MESKEIGHEDCENMSLLWSDPSGDKLPGSGQDCATPTTRKRILDGADRRGVRPVPAESEVLRFIEGEDTGMHGAVDVPRGAPLVVLLHIKDMTDGFSVLGATKPPRDLLRRAAAQGLSCPAA